jgi:hypothetical protein
VALAHWQAYIQDVAGNIVPGASITVRDETSGGPLASLYADRDGVTPLGNPITSDADGLASFYAATGEYRLQVSSGSYSADLRYVNVGFTVLVPDDSVTTIKIQNAAVTYAKMQDVSATSRLLGRKTAGSGDVEECTLSEALDFVGSAAQGDILYRNATGWARLPAGTAGQYLYTQGAGANPLWAGVWTPGYGLATSGTVTNVSSLDLVMTDWSSYRGVRFVLYNFVPATDDVELWMRVSTDGGVSYDAGASDYSWSGVVTRDNYGSTIVSNDNADSEILLAGNVTAGESVSNVANEGGVDVIIDLLGHTLVRYPRVQVVSSTWFAATVPDTFTGRWGAHREAAQNTDAVRFLFESGNIASGSYAVYVLL